MKSKLIKQILKKKGKIIINISGKSMNPFIINNDELTIKPLTKLTIGKIVLINKTKIVVHRIVFVYKTKFFTKGDASTYFDGIFKRDEILGEVVKSNKYNFLTFYWRFFSFTIAIFSLILGATCYLFRKITYKK